MTTRLLRLIPAAVLALFAAGPVSADDPLGVEVLARGPVHEAYATTVEFPTPSPVVPKAPPAPIEELPPDQKPDGDNVQWIPGYWHWDEERTDFIWISGFWRVPPPGRVWVSGSWRDARGGWQWVQGFWQDAAPVSPTRAAAPQAEIEYLPPPPQPLELAPSVPAPAATSLYVPGNWVWRGRYVWRPGFYIDYRPGWMWVPAHYRWSNCGYVYVEGYWDYPLEARGVLFAPVVFAPTVYVRPAFVYTPTYVVSHNCMVGALFVRRGYGAYYFGDYFEPRYATIGFSSWCGSVRGTSFAVSVGFGRGAYYDPMWSYYQVHYRSDPVWASNVTEVYVGRYRGDVPRPPRTLVQQTTVVNNITNVTNVTNNTTNVTNNKTVNNVSNVTMVAPLKQVSQTNSTVVLKPVEKADRVKEQQHATELRQVGIQRQKLEASLAQRNLTPTQPTDQPRQVKLDVPQQVTARAQAPLAPAKSPPPPVHVQSAEVKNRVTTTPPAVDPKTAGRPTTPTPMGATPLPLPPAPKPMTPVAPKPLTPMAPKSDLPPKLDPKPMSPTLPAPKVDLPPRGDAKPALPPAPPPLPPAPLFPKGDAKPALPPTPPPSLPKLDPKPSLPPPAPMLPAGKPEAKGPPLPPMTPRAPSAPPAGKQKEKDEKKKDQ